ncbi:protein vein isoform X3 [Culex quinquefasciatus]|uniref:protein vein isoform X3 n=1 Tax=Culex quinquefasciatus TaxID=7176 RepID=UPI0018E3AF81|nr:protein vein isoform X3 [Culex quinquefasciatus]
MYLRKWSPIKYLMYLWLAILVWIFCRCESVATMHLAPVGVSSSSSSSSGGSSLSSSTSVSSGSSSSRNSIAEQLFANGMHYRGSGSTSPYQWRPSEVTTQRSATFTKTLDRRWTPTPPAQVASSSFSSSSYSSSSSYHHPINYANRVLVENANKQLISHGRPLKDQLAASSLSQSSTSDNHSSSIISTSSSINVEAVQAEQRLQHQWRLRMSQKRARRLAHRTQLANRNRRDSVRPLPTSGSQQQAPSRRPPNQQGPTANLPANGRRYCSARDPATLAFDAPIVFEGKVKSMSSDRRANFSVTFELVAVHKKYTKFYLPSNVRLQFSYRNNSECDIYRETYRERGIVREELEQGKVYFLFVKQIDVGNFTILGQPIRKTRRTTNGVLEGVSEKYGKRPEIYSITSNVTRQEGKRVRLVCKVRGQPPPKVTWFKDKRSINRNVTKYAQVHLKKRSELIIHSVIPSDAGEYECRAKNKYAKISNSTHVRITAKHSSTKQPTTPATPEPPYKPRPCRGPGAEHFCLNSGTCIHFEELQEWAYVPKDSRATSARTKTSTTTRRRPASTRTARTVTDTEHPDGQDLLRRRIRRTPVCVTVEIAKPRRRRRRYPEEPDV